MGSGLMSLAARLPARTVRVSAAFGWRLIAPEGVFRRTGSVFTSVMARAVQVCTWGGNRAGQPVTSPAPSGLMGESAWSFLHGKGQLVIPSFSARPIVKKVALLNYRQGQIEPGMAHCRLSICVPEARRLLPFCERRMRRGFRRGSEPERRNQLLRYLQPA